MTDIEMFDLELLETVARHRIQNGTAEMSVPPRLIIALLDRIETLESVLQHGC